MKKDRNCSSPYPVYPFQGMPMMQMGPMMQPGVNFQGYQQSNFNDQNFNTLNNQIKALENRVTNLENLIGNNNYSNYNNNTYQMM